MSNEIGTLRTRLSFEEDAGRGLKGFKDDLRGLRSEMNVAKSQGQEYSRSLRGMAEQSEILNRRLKVQREQVQELRRRYEESARSKGENARQTENLRNKYNDALASMNRTEEQLRQLRAEIERQQNPWRRLSEGLDSAGKKMQTTGREMTRFGRSWTMRVTTPILGAAGAALKAGMDFEEGMSQVQAISGATGAEFESLRELAKELGSTTRFSATEAASGMEFLARAGFDTNEIISAMPGMLDLAASANMDLGRAADITSNIISGFGYEAEEAGRVADVLAAASASANTDVEGLGGAMATVAPVAATLGLDFEELAASVGMMADAGIDGSQAGRMLRQGFLRLSNPTGAAADLIEELGINVFDSSGNMKSMDEVLAELSDGLDGMGADARTAALATIFGAESTAGWSALLERGSVDLANYADELRNSEGAAADMAAIMEDNAKGAMREFRSALEGAGIAMSEHMIPAVTEWIEKGTDLIRQFGELDAEQQEQIIKWGLLAAAVGPASLVLGNLVTTAGTLLRGLSLVTGAIAAKGGLIAALGLLTNPIGLTVAGVGALAGGLYLWNRRSEDALEVNLDLATSYMEQADTVEGLTDRYEELRRKSGFTTDQIGELLDIQTRMQNESDPGKLKELEDAYNKIAEESGLSRKEIDELLEANNRIIEQTPEVETTFTRRGNAVIETTEAVRDQIDALRDLALQELQDERLIALERQAELQRELADLRIEEKHILEQQQAVREMQGITEDEIDARLQEIVMKRNQEVLSAQELEELANEELRLIDLKENGYEGTLAKLRDQLKENAENVQLTKEELSVLEEIDSMIAEIYLKELDINAAGQEGLAQADEKLAKLREEKSEIEEQISLGNDQGGVLQDHLDKLNEQIRQHESIIGQIEKETDLTSDLLAKDDERNRKLNAANAELSDMEYTTRDIGRAQDETNSRIDEGTKKAEEMHRELSKDATKNVTVTDNGTIADLNARVGAPVTKRVTINATPGNRASVPIAAYATGTDNHPGGPFIAGEQGFELGRMGNHWEMLNAGLYDRPAGYEVFTHDESKKIIRALNTMPAYATGVSASGEAGRIVNRLNQQERPQTQQTRQPIHLHVDVDGETIATQIIDDIDKLLGRNESMESYMQGVR